MSICIQNEAGEVCVLDVSPEMAPRVQQALSWLPPETVLGDLSRVEPATRRVASKVASYFAEGDLVLYGKYKNKKGRIIRIFVDEKGHPAIEVEPVPKGRKQNKIIGLYKIWKAPKEMHDKFIAERVAARFLRAAGLGLGQTVERGDVRIHRFHDFFKVWDLTNAGKRGKKVRVLVLGPSSRYPHNPAGWMEGMSKALPEYRSYDAVKRFVDDLLVDFPDEIDVREQAERGVDVTPGGFEPLKIKTPKVYVEADYGDFLVKNLEDQYNETTCIPAAKGGKKSVPQFYRWVKDNMARLQRMSFYEIVEAMRKEGIRYHQYCAMD